MSRQHRPYLPQATETTRRRWANKRDHVLRRLDRDPTITLTARSVARAIAQFSDSSAKPCWPAQTTVAEMLGVCPKTVQRAVAELEAGGYVAVRRHPVRYKPDRRRFDRKTNAYTLRMPKGQVEDYRPGQRRRYRSQEWKARAAAWIAAHRPSLSLQDTGQVSSSTKGVHPGAHALDSSPRPRPHNPPGAENTPGHAPDTPDDRWTGEMTPAIAALIASTRARLRGPTPKRPPAFVP